MEANTLSSEVEKQCKQYFAPTDHFILAISGGVDSMVLLDIMTKLFPKHCTVVTIDHHIRATSQEDTQLVVGYCKTKQIECIVEHIDMPRLSPANIGLEETARHERYRILEAKRVAYKACAVVTAHHAQDQYETQLMHLIRGCDIPGLIGMATLSGQTLFRPLLKKNKAELITYAQTNKISWHEDETNQDTSYLRNHIRHDWEPLLPLTLFQSIGSLAQAISTESTVAIAAWQQESFTKDSKMTRHEWRKLSLYLRLIWLHDWLSKKCKIEDVSSAWLGHVYHWFETARSGSKLSYKGKELCRYEAQRFCFSNDFSGQA